jgi:hypothetical protein
MAHKSIRALEKIHADIERQVRDLQAGSHGPFPVRAELTRLCGELK